MAQYLRSLSTKIPTVSLNTSPTLVSCSLEATQYGSCYNRPHLYRSGRRPGTLSKKIVEGNPYRNPYQPRVPSVLTVERETLYFSPSFNAQNFLDDLRGNAVQLSTPQPRPQAPSDVNAPPKSNPKETPDPDGKPTPDQINKIYIQLQNFLPNFFAEGGRFPQHVVAAYSENCSLIDNIRQLAIHGRNGLSYEMWKVQIYHRLRYTKVKLELVSMTQDLKDGKVVAHWRVKADQRSFFAIMQRLILSRDKTGLHSSDVLYEGVNYYDISGIDGKVFRLTVDRTMYDKLPEAATNKKLKLLRKIKLEGGTAAAFICPLVVGTLENGALP